MRNVAPTALLDTYKDMSPIPKENSDESQGVINVLTAVDVRYPPKEGDLRIGGVKDQFRRILRGREKCRLELLDEAEIKKRFPDRYRLENK